MKSVDSTMESKGGEIKVYRETFASKLKFARQRTGFTQREVARELEIPQSCIAKYETGKLEPSVETLGKLAEFYSIDLNWLFGTRGDTGLYAPDKERDTVARQMIENKPQKKR